MKRLFVALAAATLLAGCGGESAEEADAAPRTWDFGGGEVPTDEPEPPTPSLEAEADVDEEEVAAAAAPAGTLEGEVFHLELPEEARKILTPESKLSLDVLAALAPRYEPRPGQVSYDRMPEADYLCANTFGPDEEVAAQFTLGQDGWESRLLFDPTAPTLSNPRDPVIGVSCAWYPIGEPQAWDILLNFSADPDDPDPCYAAVNPGISCVEWDGDLFVYGLHGHPYRGDHMDILHEIEADDQALDDLLRTTPKP